MDSISIKVPVVVKAILTEKLKSHLLKEFSKVSEQMDLEIQQINIDRQRELDNNPEQSEQIARFFGNEIVQRQQRKQEALGRHAYISKLAIGAEIVQGTMERQVDLKIGDDFRKVMNVEVLIDDDKIVAIRG